METINPYAPPKSRAPGAGATEMKNRVWSGHLTLGLVLLVVWFFVGGAISIGGSRIESAIDGLGFLVVFAYMGIALLIGILRSIRGR